MRGLRELDIPPLWLAVFAAAGWMLTRIWALPVPGGRMIGGALMALGAGLLLGAVAQMVLRRTSAIPRRAPAVLVRDGLFALSRNPIYLGDAIALAGWLLWRDGIWTLWLVPLFMALIARRYILPEEATLAARFGPEYEDWCRLTRRWL